MTTTNSSRYISVQEAADDFAVSVQFIWKLIREGRFPAKFARLGAVIRIERASWNAFLDSGSTLTPTSKRGRKPKATPPLDLQRQRELSHASSI